MKKSKKIYKIVGPMGREREVSAREYWLNMALLILFLIAVTAGCIFALGKTGGN